jgi:hypothetical protein
MALVLYGAWNGVSSLFTASVAVTAQPEPLVPPYPAPQDMPSQQEIDRMITQAKDIIEKMHERDADGARAAEPVTMPYAGE